MTSGLLKPPFHAQYDWTTGVPDNGSLSVLKRCVPKTLAFAFGLRLRSKTRCFKTRVLGKPQERLRFRACVLKR